VFTAAQLIDQTRFSHIGPAGKHDLRPVADRQLAGQAVRGQKFAVVPVHGKSFHITAAGSLAGFSLAIRLVACGTVWPLRTEGCPGRISARFNTWERFSTGTKWIFCLTSASTS